MMRRSSCPLLRNLVFELLGHVLEAEADRNSEVGVISMDAAALLFAGPSQIPFAGPFARIQPLPELVHQVRDVNSNIDGAAGVVTPASTILTPAHHVRLRVEKLKEIGASETIVQAIQHGVELKLHKKPRHHFPQRVDPLVEPLVQDLVNKGVLLELSKAQTDRTKVWTPLFATSKKDGGHRLITDLRNLNSCIKTPKFKQDSWATVVELLTSHQPAWAFKLPIPPHSPTPAK